MELNEKTLKNILTDQRKEYERYMGALSEDTQAKVSAVAEQLVGMKEILDSHTEMIGSTKEDVEVIKMDIEFIKGGMKKKVDYDEFVALERRLSVLESRVAR